jgi:dihydroorotate dehydrogenase electron transfer subunit
LLAWRTNVNRLRIVQIKEIKQENPSVKTLTFEEKTCLEASPGQFVMVWIPGLDEIPMSISCALAGGVSISVEKVGQATSVLHRMKQGDLIGVRGPLGNGFSMTKEGNILIVGGGTGLIPLTFLGERLAELDAKITFLTGAKTRNELLFMDRVKSLVQKAHGRMVVTTDDGSYGIKGIVTQPAVDLMREEEFDRVYACGPEHMIHKMLLLTEKYNIPLEVSLERLMRCAIGICGSCILGGLRVCVDGPVFTGEQLQQVKDEFGRFKLDFDGTRVKL